MEINLAGEIVPDHNRRLTFRRGVSSLPSLGDAVMLADKHDLKRVYAPPQAASVQIGSLFQDPTVPARLLVDDLLAKHFLVVGSTGSGKSSAVTCILQRLLHEHSHAHMLILDIHNEYSAAFGGLVEPINLDNFSLPVWMLDFTEMVAALVSNDTITMPRWKSWPCGGGGQEALQRIRHQPCGALRKSKARWSSRSTRHPRSACPMSWPGWTNTGPP